ncbi:hypothetical protein R6Q59_015335 [Mikania micrantha]
MASRCNRFVNKSSISNLKSAFMSASMPKSPTSSPKFHLPSRSTASPVPRFSAYRRYEYLFFSKQIPVLHLAEIRVYSNNTFLFPDAFDGS